MFLKGHQNDGPAHGGNELSQTNLNPAADMASAATSQPGTLRAEPQNNTPPINTMNNDPTNPGETPGDSVIYETSGDFAQSSVGADVFMPPVNDSFTVPEGGATAVASLTVDDWGKLTISGPGGTFVLDLTSAAGTPGDLGGHTQWSDSGSFELSPGTYKVSITHQNIDMPHNEYNQSVCSYSIVVTAHGPSNSSSSSHSSSSSSGISPEPDPGSSSSSTPEPDSSSSSCPSSSSSSSSSSSLSSSVPDPDSSSSSSSDVPPEDKKICCKCGSCTDSEGNEYTIATENLPGDPGVEICMSLAEFQAQGGSPSPQPASFGFRSTARETLESCGALRYQSSWAWRASLDSLSGLVTIMPPTGAALYFNIRPGSATAMPAGVSRKRDFRVQLLDEQLSPCTAGAPAFLSLVDADGQKVRFSVQTGAVVSMTSASGKVVQAADYFQRVKNTYDDAGNLVSSYSAAEGLMRTSTGANGSLVMEWYAPSAVTVREDGEYDVAGEPYKTSSYKSSESEGVRTTVITRQQRGLPAHTITRTEEPGRVTITKGTGDDTIIRTIETNRLYGGMVERVESVKGINDAEPASCNRTVKKYTDGGWLLVSETEAFNTPVARTTTYEYNEQYRLSRINRPDGGYTRYEYDKEGRVTLEAEPWADGGEQTTRTVYAASSSRFYDNRPVKVYTDYQPAGGSRLNIKVTDFTYEDTPALERVTRTVYAAGIGHQQVSMEETYGEAAAYPYAAGKTKCARDISGVQTFHEYEAASEHGAVHKKTVTTKVNGELVAGQSRKTESFIAEDETITFEQESVWDGNAWLLLSSAAHEYDEERRRVKTTRGNGRVSMNTWMCCGLLRETDEDGVTTSYGYNSAHQLVETIRSEVSDGNVVVTPETITTYVRDAAGRILQTRRDIGAMTMTESMEYDNLGRIVKQTDALGRVTARDYSVDGLTETVTAPSGATFITEHNTDGSIAHEYGTGQRELYHVYDFNNNRLRETVKLADRTAILSQTLSNGFGHTVVQTSPTTVGYFYDRSDYNAKGQLVRTQRDTGSGSGALSMAPTLYEYDTFGNVIKQTLVLADQPAPDNSPIQEYGYGVENTEDGVYQVTTQIRYNAEGNSLTSIRKQLLSRLSGKMEAKTVLVDERGLTSMEWTEYGINKKRIQKSSIPTSEITAQTVAVDGLTLSQTDHAGVTSTASRVYTAAGMTLTNTDGRGNTTTAQTDVAGRTLSVTDAAGSTTMTQYGDVFDQPAVVTDALGNTSCFKYDARGRKTAEWGTAVQPALFAWDDADRMVSLTTFRANEEDISEDPSERTDGDTTAWTYHDATGLETRKTYADGSHVDKTYDAFNNLATEINARGIVKTCTWETATGVLKGISFSDATPGQSFVYNHLGQMVQVTDVSGQRSFTYNQYGEPESDSLTADDHIYLVSERSDEFGRPAGYRVTVDNRDIQNTGLGYDRQGRISSLGIDGTAAPFTWSYGEHGGLMEELAYPNGMSRRNTYEERRDLITVIDYQRPGSANPPARHEYEYDVLGRPVQRKDTWNTPEPRTTRRFTYNSRSELVGDQLQSGDRFGYQYDNIGNRKEALELGDTTDYSANRINQYDSIVKNKEEAFTPEYDADGNQTLVKTTTGIWTVTYNAENRPVRFENASSSTVVECSYDYMGRRVVKKVAVNGQATCHARYLYRGYLQVAELDLQGEAPVLVHSYIWDPTEPAATRILVMTRWNTTGMEVEEHLYCMHDALKNVTSLFGEGRGRRTLYEYRPFGGLISAEGDMAQENKFRFSSEYMDDELGLIYYNYRHLNPLNGRWINRDLILEQDGWNLYGFIENRISNSVDLLGFLKCPWSQPSPPKPGLDPTAEPAKLNIDKNACPVSVLVEYQGWNNIPRLAPDGKLVIYNPPNGQAVYGVITVFMDDGSEWVGRVVSGGYRNRKSCVKPGNDTSTPAGHFTMEPTPVEGGTKGFPVNTGGTGRNLIRIHAGKSKDTVGSEGCITVPDPDDWEELRQIIMRARGECCKKKKAVPITIRYNGIIPCGNQTNTPPPGTIIPSDYIDEGQP